MQGCSLHSAALSPGFALQPSPTPGGKLQVGKASWARGPPTLAKFLNLKCHTAHQSHTTPSSHHGTGPHPLPSHLDQGWAMPPSHPLCPTPCGTSWGWAMPPTPPLGWATAPSSPSSPVELDWVWANPFPPRARLGLVTPPFLHRSDPRPFPCRPGLGPDCSLHSSAWPNGAHHACLRCCMETTGQIQPTDRWPSGCPFGCPFGPQEEKVKHHWITGLRTCRMNACPQLTLLINRI